MGYHIEYRTEQKKHANKNVYVRLPILIAICFLFFLFLVDTMWPAGTAWIQKTVLFDRGIIAVSALNDLADDLGYGEMLETAFSDFCRKLIS